MKLMEDACLEQSFQLKFQFEISLELTLFSGQAFRWKKINDDYVCGLGEHLFILTQLEPSKINVTSISKNCPECRILDVSHLQSYLTQYFSVELFQKFNMKQYLISDEILKENYSQDLKGLVLLSQDVVENLFSFICSANNNIKRISLMVEFLANSYGKHIGTYCGKEFHSFPTLLDLKLPNLTEQLEINNFGYRGKRIAEAVEFLLSKGGEAYLKKLKSKSYNDTHKELCEIPGIGAKVADCISLMSMNHFMAVPIDTHMYQVAKAQYKLEPQAKTLTPKNYRKIRSFYQNLWGKYAGIVQLVVLILFAKILSLCLRKLSSLSMVDFFQFFE